ncbi:MAG: OmpA family protein [Kofleriaceae bacterium]
MDELITDARGGQRGGTSPRRTRGVAAARGEEVARALLRRVARGAAAALALLWPAAAAAQALEEPGDFSIERFRWTFARTGVLAAESAEIPVAGSWDFGMWLGTANDPLVLYREDELGERAEVSSLVAQRTAATLLGSYAPGHGLELGVELPLILAQSRSDTAPGVGMMLDSIAGAGLGDLRLAPKLGLLRAARHGVDLAALVSLTLPTGGSEAYHGERGVALAPEVLVSREVGVARLAANVGYRARRNASLLNLRVTDELFAELAGAARASERVELALGLSLATAATSPRSSDNQDYAEARAGVTWEVSGPLTLSLVGGLGLQQGFGAPDWRGVLAFRFGAVRRAGDDRDGDGVLDVADACVDEREDLDGFQDDDGCPDPDNDGDGVLDVADGAPLAPEDRDGFQDEDGVPDPDNDGDERLDAVDRCPLEPETVNGFQDDDGCPDVADRDGDGLLEDADRCPEEPEDRDGFQDDDGCPDPDNDGDHTLDARDRCPNEAGPAENGGCPDRDRDGDGVIDRLDNCPDERGPLGNRGCAKKQLVVLRDGRLEILDIIYFAIDRDEILKRSFALLDNVAAVIKAHPELTSVEIEGHTDSLGDDAYNKDLSQRRAAAVQRFLESRGVRAGLLHATGHGEERPVADNATKAGRAKNRRVEFKLGSEPAARSVDFPADVIEAADPKPAAP